MGYCPVDLADRADGAGIEALHVRKDTCPRRSAGPTLAEPSASGNHGRVNDPVSSVRATPTPALTTTVFAADGTELSGSRYTGSGVPVLLVHGFGSSAHSNWVRTGWVRDLTAAGRSVITVDLRGHGLSGHPTDPGAYRLRTLVSDVQALVAALAPADRLVDAVGYSLGSRVLAELAQFGGIRRLVLAGSDGRPLYEDVDIPEVVAALRAGQPTSTEQAKRIVRIARALPGTNQEAMAAIAAGLADEDPQAGTRTPYPGVPVLIAGGDKDEMFTGAREWVERINQQQIAIGRHHGDPTQDPAEYLEVPGRNHVTAVTSAVLRAAAVEFLGRP